MSLNLMSDTCSKAISQCSWLEVKYYAILERVDCVSDIDIDKKETPHRIFAQYMG